MTKKDLLHPNRFLYALIFAGLFSMVGYFVPKIYLQYFDTKNYITFTQPVTFNRKIVHKCDTVIATTRVKSLVSSKTELQTKIVRIYKDGSLKGVFQYPKSDSFTVTTGEEGKLYTIPIRLPCDKVNFEPGVYIFEAVLFYRVGGVEKTYDIVSDQLTIVSEDVKLENNPLDASSSSRLDSELR